MADALVERRPPARFFCHRCNIEFEDVLQDYTCPYCASGFIEQLEEAEGATGSGDDFSDADMSNLDDMTTIDEMSNLDDSDDMQQSTPPMLNDLAFLMSGGRLRGAGRRETLMEQLVWMIGGARGGTVAAGAPFVLVGAPGDYVFGGEGLDAVVTQLLGQLENAGPPPLPREQINAIPSEPVTAEQAACNTTCSVCWDAFQVGEMVSRLECNHIFHATCIAPWLQLHATCPICRRSLLPEEGSPPPDASPSRDADRDSASNNSSETPDSERSRRRSRIQEMMRQQVLERRARESPRWFARAAMGSSGTEGASTEPTSPGSTTSSSSNTNTNTNSTHESDALDHLNMDVDFD